MNITSPPTSTSPNSPAISPLTTTPRGPPTPQCRLKKPRTPLGNLKLGTAPGLPWPRSRTHPLEGEEPASHRAAVLTPDPARNGAGQGAAWNSGDITGKGPRWPI
jgi:hypothetical protein